MKARITFHPSAGLGCRFIIQERKGNILFSHNGQNADRKRLDILAFFFFFNFPFLKKMAAPLFIKMVTHNQNYHVLFLDLIHIKYRNTFL